MFLEMNSVLFKEFESKFFLYTTLILTEKEHVRFKQMNLHLKLK